MHAAFTTLFHASRQRALLLPLADCGVFFHGTAFTTARTTRATRDQRLAASCRANYRSLQSHEPCQAPSPQPSLSSRPPATLQRSLTSSCRSLRAIALFRTPFIRVVDERTTPPVTAAMPSKFKPLTLAPINFSLTEGTSIPAPLDSPPETPRPPTPGKGPLSSHPTPKSPVSPHHPVGSPNGKASEDSVPEPPLTRGRTSGAASGGLSPTSPGSQTRRPSSVRQFLGLRTLSSKDSLQQDERPGSPATISGQPSLTRKKSTGWFGSKRKSSYFGSVPEGSEKPTAPLSRMATNGTLGTPAPVSRVPAAQTPPQKKGPPPPALPQLNSFGVTEKTLSFDADDMFKNIK